MAMEVAMEVVGFVGSPRKEGNTATLVNEVLKGSKETGADTKLYYLNEMNIRGCQGCRACKKLDGACIQQDDMTPLYATIKAADAFVIGTPVYFQHITAQTKTFTDRLYPFLNLDFTHKLGKGKRTVMVYTQGNPAPEAFQSSFDLNKRALAIVGFNIAETIVATGTRNPDDVLSNREIMDRAYRAGKSLVSDQD
jgi:multimeric flavodoxin WrbA